LKREGSGSGRQAEIRVKLIDRGVLGEMKNAGEKKNCRKRKEGGEVPGSSQKKLRKG